MNTDKQTEQIPNYKKAYRSYQLDVNRLTKKATNYKESSIMWKLQFQKLNEFVKKLLAEERITKQELMPYSPKHKNLNPKNANQ